MSEQVTVQVFKEYSPAGVHHGFDVTSIELLAPNPSAITKLGGNEALANSSISIANLLKDVELSYEYGVKTVEAMTACRHFIETGSRKEILQVFNDALSRRVRISPIISEAEQTLGSDWRQEKVSGSIEQSQGKGLKL